MDLRGYYLIGDFSDISRIPRGTLKRMEREGTLVPAYKNELGWRYYSKEQLAEVKNIDVMKLEVKYEHSLKCWECGKSILWPTNECYYRLMCESCRKKYEAEKEETLRKYIRLKKEVMYERALRIMEKSETLNMGELEEAAKAIKEYLLEKEQVFDSSHEIITAIMILNSRTRIRGQYEVAGKRIDLYLPDLNCGVEVDGVLHKGRELVDRKRDRLIRAKLGKEFEIIRIPTKYIEKNPAKIVEYIKKAYSLKKEIRGKNHGILPPDYSKREKEAYKKVLDY